MSLKIKFKQTYEDKELTKLQYTLSEECSWHEILEKIEQALRGTGYVIDEEFKLDFVKEVDGKLITHDEYVGEKYNLWK